MRSIRNSSTEWRSSSSRRASGSAKTGERLVERDTVFREVRGSLAGIPFEGQSHALNVLDNLGIRLTPELSCERFYYSRDPPND